MKFRDICNNNEMMLKRSEISVGDRGNAYTTVVCCLHL